MTTRHLEPTPGWCERARRILCCACGPIPLSKEERDEVYRLWKESADACAKPAPEPLPHEWTGKAFSVHDKCKHCGLSPCASWLDAEAVNGPCPARNPKPAPEPVVRESRKTDEPVQEQTVARADVESANVRSKEYWDSLERVAAVVRSWPKWMRGETTLPEPAAKDAELPELSTLPDAILKFANGMFPDDTLAMVRALQFANAILAEVDRRIKAHALADGEDTIPRIGQIAREVAREEIGKARVQIKRLDDGWDDYNFGRIVPGEK